MSSLASSDILAIRNGLRQELERTKESMSRMQAYVDRGERVLSGLEGLLAASGGDSSPTFQMTGPAPAPDGASRDGTSSPEAPRRPAPLYMPPPTEASADGEDGGSVALRGVRRGDPARRIWHIEQ